MMVVGTMIVKTAEVLLQTEEGCKDCIPVETS